MKIAIPLFGERVSPHFGASSEVLLVETQSSKVIRKSTIHVRDVSPEQMARCLSSLGVDKVICGGIQCARKQWLTDNSIQVVDNQKGSAESLVTKMIARERAI